MSAAINDPVRKLAKARWAALHLEVRMLRDAFPTLTDESKESRTLERVERKLAHAFRDDPSGLSVAIHAIKPLYKRRRGAK